MLKSTTKDGVQITSNDYFCLVSVTLAYQLLSPSFHSEVKAYLFITLLTIHSTIHYLDYSEFAAFMHAAAGMYYYRLS